ncbi:ArnT family glycosyltransferase [Parvularcula sp. LCG005]|uniref:ArnT family glycosyltransferase n=1 Tax=Parvularcula sp. LCG005 TaxID=3078805 RepID=UPI0029427157|nr:glycosyltransferase family 39 protein [Parvularcula sp. LCG005]WOI53734.1 glycosyltransferase family 39 protein [Parvularcula sp. LCG005]
MLANAKAYWSSASFSRRLYIILAVGLVLRLIWAVVIPAYPVSDQEIYLKTSTNLASVGVYGVEPDEPFSYWPVGASIFYSIAYKIFGINMFAVKLVNLIAGGGLIYTTALLARRWFGDMIGIWSAIAVALWPSLIMYVSLMASEVLFALFVNLFLIAWQPGHRQWYVKAAIAGLCVAAAILIRPIALLIPFVMVGLDWIHARRLSVKPVAVLGVVVVVAAILITPWSIRNTNLHGTFVLVSTNGSPNLWMGNHEGAKGYYVPLPDYVEGMSEVERAEVLGDEAKEYILSHPMWMVRMTAWRIAHTHSWETIAVVWNERGIRERLGGPAVPVLKAITYGSWLVFLGFGLGGVVIIVMRSLREATFWRFFAVLASPPLVFWAYYALLHGIIVSADRYHFPQIPFIAMLAVFAAERVQAKWLERRRSAVPAGDLT